MRLSLLLLSFCGHQALSLLQPTNSLKTTKQSFGRRLQKAPVAAPSVSPKSALFSATGMGSDEKETAAAWTKPRLHNSAAFRSVAILGAIAAAGWTTNSPLARLSSQATASLHLFSYATWFGTMAYTTFVAGITMFRNLPRQTFGKLQAKLFPKYFQLSSVCIVLQVSTSNNASGVQ